MAERRVSERREGPNPWFDPRFIVNIVIMVVGVYVASQVKATSLEEAAANLRTTVAEIKTQVTSMATTVSALTTSAAEQRAKSDAISREVDELKRSKDMQDARLITLEKSVATIQASRR